MPTPPDQFKKAPRRAAPKGKRVAVSAETKAAYEQMMRDRDARAKAEQHLPPDMKR